MGIDRETAGRFSFLLCIPAIVGAMVMALESGLLEKSSASTAAIAGGTLAAILVGYLALIFLLKIVKKGKFYLFSPYCWVVGALALIFSFL
jgi:undecaprenyl-diphosphatase